MFEKDHEEDGHDQGISGESQPYALPVEASVIQNKIFINDDSADPASQKCPETIGKNHEQSLCAGPDSRLALSLNIELH